MAKLGKPDKVNILGSEFKITYVDNASEVDVHKRESLWGQIDYWTSTIRIYDAGRPMQDIWKAIIHEVIHGIQKELHLKCFEDTDECDGHDELDTLANVLTDTFARNGWIEFEENDKDV